MAYQNSWPGPYPYNNGEVVNPTFPGPSLYANTNLSRQYWTGFRMNSGREISSVSRIDIEGTNSSTRSITGLVYDCLQILAPYNYDIPVYSKRRLDNLLLANRNSSLLVLPLLREIKEGLVTGIEELTAGISDTFANFATTAANIGAEGSSLTEADLESQIVEFRNMINTLPINQKLNTLNDSINELFFLFVNNLPTEQFSLIQLVPTIQELPGYTTNNLEFVIDEGQDYSLQNNAGIVGAYFTDSYEPSALPVWSKYCRAHPELIGGIELQTQPLDEMDQPLVRVGRDPSGGYNFVTSLQTNSTPWNELPNYLDANNSNNTLSKTPIGAMYASEMYTYQEAFSQTYGNQGGTHENPGGLPGTNSLGNVFNSNEIAKGQIRATYAYPSVGYGPWAATGYTGLGSGYQTYASSGLDRVKEVAEKYIEQIKEVDDRVDELDTNIQFYGMQDQDGEPFNNGFINENFEELRTYVYWTSHLQDLSKWVHDYWSRNQDFTTLGISQNFGVASQAPGGGSPFSPLPGVRQTPYSAYLYSPQQSRYRIGAHGSNSGNFSDGAGPTATRCYEPHWEWNSNRNEWIFRIAQPVIGLDGGSYTNSGYFYPVSYTHLRAHET